MRYTAYRSFKILSILPQYSGSDVVYGDVDVPDMLVMS
jgi:hypothetical protein